MIQRDYFMRMAEMLTVFLSKVLLNKEKKKFEDAENELDEAGKAIVGIDLKLFGMLGTEDIVRLMKTSDIYGGRCLISAELLREYGEIRELNGQKTESNNFYLKSLRLYTEAMNSNELPEPGKYFSEIDNLITKLSDDDFPEELKLNLIDYYEMTGKFSRSEDLIFELLESGNEDVSKKAVRFYKRLKEKSDAELEGGNLSKEEVEESLNEILSKINIG